MDKETLIRESKDLPQSYFDGMPFDPRDEDMPLNGPVDEEHDVDPFPPDFWEES